MTDQPIVTIPERDRSTDAIITFPAKVTMRDSAWLTINLGPDRPSASLCIIRTDEGIVLDLYGLDHETGEPVATTWAFDAHLTGEEEP